MSQLAAERATDLELLIRFACSYDIKFTLINSRKSSFFIEPFKPLIVTTPDRLIARITVIFLP